VHHYDPLQHQLESRALLNPGGSPCLLLGLSSIMWREAWKYGERAFRYCQLDLGHALGAIAYAAHLLGWQARPLALGSERLAKLLGLNRSEDFPSTPYPFTEAEEPEILLALQAPGLPPPSPGQLQALEAELQAASWQGQASLIDPDPGYRWPLIDQAAQASRLPDDWLASLPASHPDPLPPLPAPDPDAANTPGHAALIRQRRSGQRYNPRLPLAKDAFYRMLDALLPRPETAPWPVLPSAARVHLLLFVERVEGLPPGLYLLPRSPAGAEALRRDIAPDDGRFTGQAAVARHDPDCPPHLGLICLAPSNCPSCSGWPGLSPAIRTSPPPGPSPWVSWPGWRRPWPWAPTITATCCAKPGCWGKFFIWRQKPPGCGAPASAAFSIRR